MELVPGLVEVALQEEELISGLCATLFMSELSGPSVAGIVCSYAADASDDPGVPLKCVAALIRLLVAAKEHGSHDFVPSLLATSVVRKLSTSACARDTQKGVRVPATFGTVNHQELCMPSAYLSQNCGSPWHGRACFHEACVCEERKRWHLSRQAPGRRSLDQARKSQSRFCDRF